MDIIHGLSNLEIETKHSSSSQEEVQRNWLDLPHNLMSLIFLKLAGTIDILVSAQWVCSSWWKLSKQPHLFRSIHMEEVLTLFGRSVPLHSIFNISGALAREAIDRSCGQLVEFSVRAIADDMLLHYVFLKSSSLRCIRLVFCHGVRNIAMVEMAKKHQQLEELEIIHCSFKTIGRSCLLNNLSYFLPQLRHLNLYGNQFPTDEGLRAILDRCPHLESLDLRQCSGLSFAGDLKLRCENIQVSRLPNDPTRHDYSKYDFEYEYNSYFRMISDREDYETEFYADDVYEYNSYFATNRAVLLKSYNTDM